MPAKTLMRSGAAARLAGVSPSTLRIWEHRYGVVAPPKSASGQRTYSMKDIERLRLIKRLTSAGHAVGTVAHLSLDGLVSLLSGNQQPTSDAQRVVVIGKTAARKLESNLRPAPSIVFDDLEHAEREMAHTGNTDVMVLHISSLQGAVTDRVKTLRAGLPASNVIVVYSFGAEATAESLRKAGVTVRREPVTGNELARLVMTAQPTPTLTPTVTMQNNPRRYSDTELAALTEVPSLVACECLRHLAEIVTLLTNFEVYSIECAAPSRQDADRHRHLNDVAGTARAMFEQALARVMVEEGLAV